MCYEIDKYERENQTDQSLAMKQIIVILSGSVQNTHSQKIFVNRELEMADNRATCGFKLFRC